MTWVLHVDLDQFLVAVELQRRPELVGLPVVVGGRGDPTERGVASTASYEARAYGVTSGTPLRTAAKRLPDTAVFLPVDKPTYDAASAEVMAGTVGSPHRPCPGPARGYSWASTRRVVPSARVTV